MKLAWKLTIITVLSFLLLAAISALLYLYYKESQDRNQAYNRQRTTDILWIGRGLEQYHTLYESYPCIPSALSCDWQGELARLNPAEPVPVDPKTLEPYVYLTHNGRSMIGAKMYISPISSHVCRKSGGGQPVWLVYQSTTKDTTILCMDRLDATILSRTP